VLVEKNHVGQSGGGCARDEISKNESSTVETNGGGKEKADFFRKCSEASGGRARGGPLDPTIANDKKLREDFKYDESKDKEDAEMDIDDEYVLTELRSFFGNGGITE
jgi:hypothetical protein